MSEQEKVLFSWRVIEDSDGSIRTESYVHPEWKERKGEGFGFGPGFGPMGRKHRHGEHGRHEHGPHRHFRFEMGEPPFGPMAFAFGAAQKGGRKRARRMLDWFEQMYDDFYGPEDDDEVEDAGGAAGAVGDVA
ncbi:MAG: hypothetical protein JW910_01095 [Anaerolineae bacterium]|nr:hypothetical protein [Anaerolineae bacterium]